MTREEIARYEAAETLRDGRELRVRAVRPDDRGLLLEALRAVSADSLYRRFLGPRARVTEADVRDLLEVDFTAVVALVATLDGAIVGGARYFRLDSGPGGAAEVALLVGDAHQGLGIGALLFRHLTEIAARAGIVRLEAEVLPTNRGMFRTFERSGLPLIREARGSSVHVSITLPAAATARVDAGRAPEPVPAGERP